MPTDELEDGGWTQTEVSVETVFSLPTVRVRTATVQYEDELTRELLTEESGHDIDVTLRFFAGTRLAFDPPLSPGVAPKMIAPMLRHEAQTTFKRRLRERGLVNIDRDGSQRIRLDGKETAHLRKFTATLSLQALDARIPLACWVATWTTTEDAFIVTGGHPTVSLADCLDLTTSDVRLTRSGESYRDEFVSLLRQVE